LSILTFSFLILSQIPASQKRNIEFAASYGQKRHFRPSKKCVVIYAAFALALFFASGIQVSGKVDVFWLCGAFLLNLIFVFCKSGSLFMLTKRLFPFLILLF